MNTKQLAKITRLHPNTLRKFVKEGLLPTVPLGGSHGFEYEDDAPKLVRQIMRERHRQLVEARRASGIMDGFRAKSREQLAAEGN